MELRDGDNITYQIVQLLSQLHPNQALQNKIFREAVLDFIEQSGSGFHDEISTRLGTEDRLRKRPKKRASELDLSAEARTYLGSEELAAMQPINPTNLRLLVRALQSLHDGRVESPEKYDGLFDGRWDSSYTVSDTVTTRQKIAVEQYQWSDAQAQICEGMRRLDLLRIIYEIDRLRLTSERRTTSTGMLEQDITAAEREFAKRAGAEIHVVRALRKRARAYLNLASRQNGLGILLMLGSQTRKLWEVELNSEMTARAWTICSSKFAEVEHTAGIMQPVACKLLERRFTGRNSSAMELREAGHIFSRHFESQTTLETPAVAADRLQTDSTATADESPADPLQGSDDAAQPPALLPPPAWSAGDGLQQDPPRDATQMNNVASDLQSGWRPLDAQACHVGGGNMPAYAWQSGHGVVGNDWENWMLALNALGTSQAAF